MASPRDEFRVFVVIHTFHEKFKVDNILKNPPPLPEYAPEGTQDMLLIVCSPACCTVTWLH